MSDHIYSYEFGPSVSMRDARRSLQQAALTAEILHGIEAVRMDGDRRLSQSLRVCQIDGSTAAGRDIARLFTGFLTRQYGPGAFKVSRIEANFETAAFADRLSEAGRRMGARR
jgi:hypothetical protein